MRALRPSRTETLPASRQLVLVFDEVRAPPKRGDISAVHSPPVVTEVVQIKLVNAPAPDELSGMPALIHMAGEPAERCTVEFFTSRLANENTRHAYWRAVLRFCSWCEPGGIELATLSPPVVAAYRDALIRDLSLLSTKLHLTAVRRWLAYLTERGALPVNPAREVRGPSHIVREGQTPVLSREQAARLLGAIDGGDVLSLRDRALISVMLYNFVRVGAVTAMQIRDFEDDATSGLAWLTLREKRGMQRRIPAHGAVRDALRAYIQASGFKPSSRSLLFQRVVRGRPTDVGMKRCDVLKVVKRLARDVGLSSNICNHSFRATGITLHNEAGGRIEDAARIAGHASPATTQLYCRARPSGVAMREDLERVQL